MPTGNKTLWDKILNQSQIHKNGISPFLVWVRARLDIQQNGRGTLWDGVDREASLALSEKKSGSERGHIPTYVGKCPHLKGRFE